MEPIISPWLIYFINVSNTIKDITLGFTLIFLFSTAIAVVIYLYCKFEYEYDGDYEEKYVEAKMNSAKKKLKYSVIAWIIFTIIHIITPSKNTSIEMITASYVTEDNINTISENTKEAIDYIFDKIEGLANENTNETS